MPKTIESKKLLSLLLFLFPLTFWLHGQFIGRPSDGNAKGAKVFIPAAQTVRYIALGYDQLVADFYWLAFINYIGNGEARSFDHAELADQYLDLITGLDPYFVQPYWFCAFTVGAEQKRPLRANELIQRGMQNNPDNWYLPYIAGINMYLYAHDESAAARYYRTAARFQESPKWLNRQAGLLAAKIPSTIKEINVWESIYSSSESSIVRRHAKEKLVNLWTVVYSRSGKGPIRERAREALRLLGVHI